MLKYLLALLLAVILAGCANVIPPTGGPKDTIPPTLIKSVPANQQVQFNGSQIEMIFDEAVTLKNPKEEIIITPNTGKETQFIARKNSVVIKPLQNFERDRTYSVSFRQSVVDLNEGNPAEDLRLAFSTGDYIDSLKIFGRIQRLPEDTPAEKITVAIYQSDTFNIQKSQPSIFTRTDKKGRFIITNLKPGDYLIYAFDDKNKNLKADSQSEIIGFLNDTIRPQFQKDSIRVYASKLDVRQLKINSYRNISNYGIIRTNKNIRSYSFNQIVTKSRVVSQFANNRNEILYYPETKDGDSTKVKLTVKDSAGYSSDSTFFIKKTAQKPIKEKFQLSVTKTKSIENEPTTFIELETNLPVMGRHTDSLLVILDTIPLFKRTFQALYDTINKKINIKTNLLLPDTIKKSEITIKLDKGTFRSFFNDTSTTTLIKIPIRKSTAMAKVIVESKIADARILIQAINDKGEILEQKPLQHTVILKDLPPENIQLRAVFDENGNNEWDPGHSTNKRLPEKILYYISESKERRIPLRANWELTITWTPD